MAPVVLKLHLKNHCIRTAAKKYYKVLIDQYFENIGDVDEILMKIELLRDFLKESDFPRLRAENEKLSGAVESFVNISRDDGANFILSIE